MMHLYCFQPRARNLLLRPGTWGSRYLFHKIKGSVKSNGFSTP